MRLILWFSAITLAGCSQDSDSGGGVCASFADEASHAAVTVRVHNETGAPIYVPTTCGALLPDIEPAEGDDGARYGYGPSCLTTCEILQRGVPQPCMQGCADVTLRIENGASYEVVWDGTRLEPTSMPGACWYDSRAASEACSRIVEAPAGAYRARMSAFNACGGPVEECTCDAQGRCSGSPAGNEASPGDILFDYPSDQLVEAELGVCAFGCPD